jgi:RNA polymerase sigma-70 factor (ECF subfamily)
MTDNFDRIYEKYSPMVLRRCRKLLGCEAQAAEAMQDVFVQLLSYKENQAHHALSSLLYRIATNVCLNIIRTHSRHPTDEILLEIADHSDLESKVIAKNFIAKLFSMEPESTAWMAVLFYHDGLTLEEIAKESNLSISGVRKRLRKFKVNLRKLEEPNEDKKEF